MITAASGLIWLPFYVWYLPEADELVVASTNQAEPLLYHMIHEYELDVTHAELLGKL